MYKRILVPIDGSPASLLGLDEAIKLAKDQSAELRLLHVVNEWLVISPDASGANTGEIERQVRQNADNLLNEADAHVKASGLTATSMLLEQIGTPVGAAILRHAADWKADLIVCGTHGRRGVRRLVLGSDAEYIVRHAHIPVLLLRQPEENA